MNKIVLKIDLTNFFTDERKWTLILVNPEWENIEELQKRIENIFDLDIRFVTNDGCFVPSQESVQVLSGVESLKAFTFFKYKKPLNAAPELKETQKVKKRKIMSLDPNFMCSTPNDSKRSKYAQKMSPKVRSTEEISEGMHAEIQSQQTATSVLISYKSSEKMKKSKSKAESIVRDGRAFVEDENNDTQQNSIIKLRSIKNTSHKDHLFFSSEEDDNDNDDEISTAKSKQIENISFRCLLMEGEALKPRIFELKRKIPNVEIIEDILVSNSRRTNVAADPVSNNLSNGSEDKNLSIPSPSELCNEDKLIEDYCKLLTNNEINQTKDENTSSCTANMTTEGSCDDSSIMILDDDESIKTLDKSKTTNLNKSEEDNDESISMLENSNMINLSKSQEDNDESISMLEKSNTIHLSKSQEDNDESISTLEKSNTMNLSKSQEENDESISTLEKSNTKNLSKSQEGDQESVAQSMIYTMLKEAKPLVDLPNVCDTIVFKLSQYPNNSKKVEKLTDYIIGSCVHVNRRTKTIKISLLNYPEDAEIALRRYATNLDDSIENLQYLDLKLNIMIEPKVIE